MSRSRFILSLGLVLVYLAAVSACADSAPTPTDEATAALPERGAEPEWGTDDPRSLFDFVTSLAAERARTRWVAPEPPVRGRSAEALTYDEYRSIRFRREAAPWPTSLPFELQLDPPGGAQTTPVRVHLVSSGASRVLSFEPSMFDWDGSLDADDLGLDAGAAFGGLRILARMNRPDHLDEVISFRGSSYFRLIGPGHVYGASARGIALNTAASEPEEFPDFVDFWIQEPAPGDSALVIHALLDGPSVTGAYRFELVSGLGPDVVDTVGARQSDLRVQARLFARQRIDRLGVAPLTSMFLHGPLDPLGTDAVRPRVHDSEALVMETHAGEVIHRPITNPDWVRVTSLRDRDPRGFGLAQPERDFEAFLDLEAQYHRRPGLWVRPEGAWGEGGVLLAELPTESEFADNVVAFWAPDDTLQAGDRRDFTWSLSTFDARPTTDAQPLGVVTRARIGGAGLPGQAAAPPRNHRRVLVDFGGPGLAGLPPEVELEPVLFQSSGTVRDLRVEPLPDGGRRATWVLEGEPGVPADMRVFLRAPQGRTATWSHLLEIPVAEPPEAG